MEINICESVWKDLYLVDLKLNKSINSAIKYKNIPMKKRVYVEFITEDNGINAIKKTSSIEKYKFELITFGIFVQIDVIIINVKHNPVTVPNKDQPHAPFKIHKNIGRSDVEIKR